MVRQGRYVTDEVMQMFRWAKPRRVWPSHGVAWSGKAQHASADKAWHVSDRTAPLWPGVADAVRRGWVGRDSLGQGRQRHGR